MLNRQFDFLTISLYKAADSQIKGMIGIPYTCEPADVCGVIS